MRKTLILLAGFVLSGVMYSQSNLPACPEDLESFWTNCVGTLTFADGNKYVGEYKDNKEHGQGTYIFADGAKYVGEWKDNKRHGQGTKTLANGAKYVGEYKDDKRHEGTYTYADGDKYVGEYKDNKRHGQGTLTLASGKSDVGYFINHKYVPDICEEMGINKGTSEFGQCVLKLINKL